MTTEPQPSVNVECQHRNVNYTNPLSCSDCGAVLGENGGDFKVVHLEELSPEKQAKIKALAEEATVFPPIGETKLKTNLRRPLKTRFNPTEIAALGSLDSSDLNAETPTVLQGASQKAEKPKKPVRGTITAIEAASAKERIFVVNGVKFYAAVTEQGFRVLSACHESKKTLEQAARVLEMKGYASKVKRIKEQKGLFSLEAKERRPSGPWPDEDTPAPEAKPEV